ncbi:hypothetical protein [Streptomyces sp. NPDC057302]|uniref:hypothetical protein n=1 Tax=Streptomyces sp. NPDC057302 TaxID=3346094 RepID=UPI0036325E23
MASWLGGASALSAGLVAAALFVLADAPTDSLSAYGAVTVAALLPLVWLVGQDRHSETLVKTARQLHYWQPLRDKFTDDKRRMERISAIGPIPVDQYLEEMERKLGREAAVKPEERERRLGIARTQKAREDSLQRHREQSLELNLKQAEDQVRQQERIQLGALTRLKANAEARSSLILLAFSLILLVLTYHAAAHLLERTETGQLTPADAAQVVTAVGGAPAAIVLGIYGVLKGTALVMHAWADVVRARAGLPPAESAGSENGERGGNGSSGGANMGSGT